MFDFRYDIMRNLHCYVTQDDLYGFRSGSDVMRGWGNELVVVKCHDDVKLDNVDQV